MDRKSPEKIKKRLWRWWVRRNMCRLRGHSWTGGNFIGGSGLLLGWCIYCKRCGHHLSERDCRKGEPKRYKLPWGDTRKVNGRLYE